MKESEDKVETLLGIQVEPGLKWHKQVQFLQDKLKKRIAGLTNLRNVLPYSLMKRVTEGIFTSVLVYCLPVFGGCDKYELESLQIMQNKAARLVTNSPIRTRRKELFAQLDWLSVNQLVRPNSTVPGDIPVKLIKEFSPELTAPITKIFNRITTSAEYPRQWVTEYQIAIPKVQPPLI